MLRERRVYLPDGEAFWLTAPPPLRRTRLRTARQVAARACLVVGVLAIGFGLGAWL